MDARLAVVSLCVPMLCVGSAVARPSTLEAPPREIAFQLDSPDHPRLGLMLSFRDASIERLGPLGIYTHGRYGTWVHAPLLSLDWGPPAEASGDGVSSVGTMSAPEDPFALSTTTDFTFDGDAPIVTDRAWLRAFDPLRPPLFDSTGAGLTSDGFDGIFALPPTKPVIDWRCRRRPVTLIRYGSESDRFELVRCDGQTAPFALDKLSVLARPPGVPRPTDGLLPDEPDAKAWAERREWVDGIRVMHPRLLWALQKLSDKFPWKAIYVYSGYRPYAEVNDGTGHMSLHAQGRAMDISFFNVPKEDLFKACRELKDVGCGYYPHTPFVHVDVRRAGTGQAFWIDASKPGEPAEYVDSWPGVIDHGALSWVPESKR